VVLIETNGMERIESMSILSLLLPSPKLLVKFPLFIIFIYKVAGLCEQLIDRTRLQLCLVAEEEGPRNERKGGEEHCKSPVQRDPLRDVRAVVARLEVEEAAAEKRLLRVSYDSAIVACRDLPP